MRRRAVPAQQLHLFEPEGPTKASQRAILLADFQEWLVNEIGLEKSTADTHRRHAEAMRRGSGNAAMDEFLADPEAIVNAIKRPSHADTRRQRHTVVRELLDHARGRLSDEVLNKVISTLESSFPGRTGDQVHLLDIDLGGDSQRPRPPRPYAPAEFDALFRAAKLSSPSPMRDVALLALHSFSGIPAHLVREMRWEDWDPTPLKDGIAWVGLGPFRFVVGEAAVCAMQDLWLAEGQPSTGAVFRTIVRPREKLKPRAIHNMVSALAKRAGIPDFDLRRLRLAYAWALKAKGWDDLVLRDAFGYDSLQSLRKALRPYESESAQRRAQEVLTLTSGNFEGTTRLPENLQAHRTGKATATLAATAHTGLRLESNGAATQKKDSPMAPHARWESQPEPRAPVPDSSFLVVDQPPP